MFPVRLLAGAFLLTLLFLATVQRPAHAQVELQILSIDTSDYPNMSAEFIVTFGSAPIFDIDRRDFRLFDDLQEIDSASITVTCPPQKEPQPVHVALVADRSGSMEARTATGPPRLTVLKNGALAFVTTVRFVGSTAIGLVTFDDLPLLAMPLTNQTQVLLDAINAIKLGNGTEYMLPLIDPTVGAIPMLAAYPNHGEKRAIVFITDGLSTTEPNIDTLIETANAANITIYTITIGLPMTAELLRLAHETGGEAYGNVQDESRMRALYTSLALRLQSSEPCRIHWRAKPGCGPNSVNRTLTLSSRTSDAIARMRYVLPQKSIRHLDAVSYVWFGSIGPGQQADRQIALTAHGGAITITDARAVADTHFVITDWGGSPPPFTLQDGQQRILIVRFSASDSSVASTTFSITTEPCPTPPLTISGGVRGPRFTDILRLVTPIGGEQFSGCDSIPITWRGVPPTDRITIEFSTDDGITWLPLAKNATDFRHVWSAPNPGTGYRVRITSSLALLPDSITTVAGGGVVDADGIRATNAALISPAGTALDGDVLYVAETGAHRVRRIDLRTGMISTLAGTGSNGFSGDGGPAAQARLSSPTGIVADRGVLYIADYGNHRIRRVDLATNVITTVAGNGTSGFSGDSGLAVSAQLQFPTSVAVNSEGLFICDRGNGRIRFVDFWMRRIITIAGGGWADVGDGSPATDVILHNPGGIAIGLDAAHLNDSLYIAEEGGNRVRLIELRIGVISTIAGSGYAGFDGDGRDGRDVRLDGPRNVAVIGAQLYISDSRNHRVRMLRRSGGSIMTVAGTGVAGFGGDGGPSTDAKINAPDGLSGDAGRLVIADAANDRVRIVTISSAGRTDSSRSSFTVATGHIGVALPGKRIDMGAGGIGVGRDSLASDALCNTGVVAVTIDSVTITGSDSADFTLVSAPIGTPIDSGACTPVEFRFTAHALGSRNAKAIIHVHCGTADTLLLNGVGQAPCGFTVTDRTDFGDVIVGVATPRVLDRSICNTGAVPLSGRVTIAPSDGPFTITSGGGPFTIAPGECRSVTITMTPVRSGPASAVVDYGLAAACGRPRTLVVGRGLAVQTLEASAAVTFSALPCAPWPRDTTITLGNGGDAPLEITGLALAANNEGFTLTTTPLPTATAPLVLLPHTSASIGIRLAPATTGAKSARLVVTSNDPKSPATLDLAGRRDSVGTQLSQGSIAFSGTLAGATYPIDSIIVIRNTGTVPRTITTAAFTGSDAARFAVGGRGLPATLAPGDTMHLIVRVLGPSGDTSRATRLVLTAEPDCGDPLEVDVIETGAQPAVTMRDVDVRALLCPGEATRDTVVVIRNPGGAPLTITGATLAGDAVFTIDAVYPIIIPPGGEAAVTVHFTPPATGTFTATVTFATDAVAGDSSAVLRGERQRIGIIVMPPSLALGSFLPNVQGTGSVSVINAGTAPLLLELSTSPGSPFAVQTPGPLPLGAGDTTPVWIAFRWGTTGRFDDTLVIRDTDCGTVLRVPLSAFVTPTLTTTILLPRDSALTNTHVVLPVTITIPDRTLFAQAGVHDYTTTILFDGRVLRPDSVVGAALTGALFDDHTAGQRVSVSGSYSGTGDTLFLLHATTISSGVPRTALNFAAFAWTKPAVGVDTVPGWFVITGCSPGLSVRARIGNLKLRPMPAAGDALLEFELGEVESVDAVMVDALGRDVALIASGRYEAGTHTLGVRLGGLPAGAYTLVLRTPFGVAATPVVVAR